MPASRSLQIEIGQEQRRVGKNAGQFRTMVVDMGFQSPAGGCALTIRVWP